PGTAARRRAVEITTLAQAEPEAAGKQAEAKKVVAEGVRAEQAAPGLAEAQVKEAGAIAIEKVGVAEARVVDVMADAHLKQGKAEATILAEKLFAEAEGLTKKFQAIDALTDSARSHEEYRMALDTSLKQALASIEAGREVSKENAGVIATALQNADIDMVGGDGGMFESLVKAISLGKSIEGLTDKSPVVQELMQKYLGIGGGRALPANGSDAG